MSLPTIQADVTVYNPKFVVGGNEPFWIQQPREVEVLTLNLNSGGMRVRYSDTDPKTGKTSVKTTDLSINLFDAKYAIVER
jgi:hypothetical protein